MHLVYTTFSYVTCIFFVEAVVVTGKTHSYCAQSLNPSGRLAALWLGQSAQPSRRPRRASGRVNPSFQGTDYATFSNLPLRNSHPNNMADHLKVTTSPAHLDFSRRIMDLDISSNGAFLQEEIHSSNDASVKVLDLTHRTNWRVLQHHLLPRTSRFENQDATAPHIFEIIHLAQTRGSADQTLPPPLIRRAPLMRRKKPLVHRVVVIGDAGVGKIALIKRASIFYLVERLSLIG
jgi:hypothetical protein